MCKFYCYCRAMSRFKFGSNGLDVNVEEGDWLVFIGNLGNDKLEPIAISNPRDSKGVYQCQRNDDMANKIKNPKISLLWDINARVNFRSLELYVDHVRIFDETYDIDDVFYNLTNDMYKSSLQV